MSNLIRQLEKATRNPSVVPWFAGHRVGSNLSYRFSHVLHGWASPPEAINIIPTFRCNLRCTMCFERFCVSNYELSSAEWIEIIKKIKQYHTRIHISGGELFLYDGIMQLIENIKRSRLFLHITTNGTYLAHYAKEIVRLGVDRIDISIDGPREIHDTIRGVPGTFDRIVDGIRRVRTWRGSRTAPLIRINSIINVEHPAAIEELINLGENLRVDAIQFIHPLFLDSAAIDAHRTFLKQTLKRDINYWRRADNFRTKPRDNSAAEQIVKRLQGTWPMSVEVFPQFNALQLMAYYNMESTTHSFFRGTCRAMWNTATILPSGDVESCPDYVIGNCREDNFFSLWNNHVMKTLRRRIRDRRFFSVCRACCFFYQ